MSDKNNVTYIMSSQKWQKVSFLHPEIHNTHTILSLAVTSGFDFNPLRKWLERMSAPLRRIVARVLEVYEWHKKPQVPRLFVVHDELECGHVSTCLGWDVRDLLNAYSENPQVRAKRHQCKPCASLLAKKRPQSVGLAEVRRTA